MGNSHKAEIYIQVLDVLPSGQRLSQESPCLLQQDKARPHVVLCLAAWLQSEKVQVLPAVKTRPPLKTCGTL